MNTVRTRQYWVNSGLPKQMVESGLYKTEDQVIDFLLSHDKDIDEGSEFALALLTGKVKLVPNDLLNRTQALVTEITQKYKDRFFPQDNYILGYLLGMISRLTSEKQ